jgi:hypothetical protein
MSTVDSKVDDVVVSVPSSTSVVVSPLTSTQLVQLLTDALSTPPTTGAEAVALFKKFSDQLMHYLVNTLPSLEAKAEILALLTLKEVAAVNCSKCF